MAFPVADTANKLSGAPVTGGSITHAVPGGTAPVLTMVIVQNGDKPLDLTVGAPTVWTKIADDSTGALASDAHVYVFAALRTAVSGTQTWTLAGGVTSGKWAWECMPWTGATDLPTIVTALTKKNTTAVSSWGLGTYTAAPADTTVWSVVGVSLGNQTGGAQVNLTSSFNTELTDTGGTVAFSTVLETSSLGDLDGGTGLLGTANLHAVGATGTPKSARSLSFGFFVPGGATTAAQVHSSGGWLIVPDENVGASNVVVLVNGSFSLAPGNPTSTAQGQAVAAPINTVDGAFTVTASSPTILFAGAAVGEPFPIPPSFEATEALYNRLPQAYRDHDTDGVLRGYMALIGDQEGELEVILDRLGGRYGTSHLVDPAVADAAWLPWLAAVVGVALNPGDSTATQRTKIAGWKGVPVGSLAAVRAAVSALLTGAKTVVVEDHADGDPWKVNIHSRASETPDSTAVTAAAQAVAPAGVEVAWQAGVATWTDIHTLYLTWADLNGKTFTEIMDTKVAA